MQPKLPGKSNNFQRIGFIFAILTALCAEQNVDQRLAMVSVLKLYKIVPILSKFQTLGLNGSFMAAWTLDFFPDVLLKISKKVRSPVVPNCTIVATK